MFNTLGCINSLQNHTSHIVDENEIFISLHIPWFSTNCNGLVNSKVLCATQITLASESKIFSHGSTVSPKKTKFDYKIYYKEIICGHFTLCIKDTIILWILFYWTYEEDMNLLEEMIIIRWIYAHIYLSQTRSSDWKKRLVFATCSLAYLTNLRSRCPSSRNNLSMRALEPCWPLPCLAVRCILSACGALACWKGSPKLPASRQTTYPSTEG